MSFSSSVKGELCKVVGTTEGNLAQLYGMLLFARSFSQGSICLHTENENVCQRVSNIISGHFSAHVDVSISSGGGRQRFTLTVPIESDRVKIVGAYYPLKLADKPETADIENLRQEVRAGFISGAYLSCGAVTDPELDYHMEFCAQYKRRAEYLCKLLAVTTDREINANSINRKGSFVVYIKDHESIVDLLTYMGAPLASMHMIQVKMLKEMRNYVNRTTNFETANISKTAFASMVHMQAIDKIEDKFGLESLPDELYELAKLRLENPEMSLRELGKSLTKPLSRSGVNHRMAKIMKIANGDA